MGLKDSQIDIRFEQDTQTKRELTHSLIPPLGGGLKALRTGSLSVGSDHTSVRKGAYSFMSFVGIILQRFTSWQILICPDKIYNSIFRFS